MRIGKSLLLSLALGFSIPAFGQFTDRERTLIQDVLNLGNVSERDLQWARTSTQNVPMMPFIRASIDQPITAAEKLLMLHGSVGKQSVGQVLQGFKQELWEEPVGVPKIPEPHEESELIPPALRASIGKLAEATASASQEVKRATAGLTDEESRILIESLPQICVEGAPIQFDFVTRDPASLEACQSLLEKVDLRLIRDAAIRLSDVVDQVLPVLKRFDGDFPTPISVRLHGILVRLSGKGDDVHEHSDSFVNIDFGGNDRYLGRVGAGVRYASVHLDLGGDDQYLGKDAGVGVGLLGIGLARDLEGSDRYAIRNLSAGAGIAGVGILVDSSGADTYRSTSLAQGFAIHGVGLLIDGAGDDDYRLGLLGQGAGRTDGVGSLIDREGDDTYRAGGILLNSPLFSDVFYSFAQGFGMGFRDDAGGVAGGVGLLTDLEGKDAYLSETYAQAASYWMAVGSLYDGSGHDTYSAYHYAQSSAMHLCSAFLYELAGNDQYGVAFGASHAIGHDYGVAFLLDRAGNDHYFAEASAPATGNANGLAFFIEVEGTDRYQGPTGVGNAARGSGSAGFFVDGSGQDRYQQGISDGLAERVSSWGSSLDWTTLAGGGPAIVQPTRPRPGSIPLPNTTEIEAIYARATQWQVGQATQSVEEGISTLIGVGIPAVNWMLDNKLARADRLQQRAFVQVIAGVGEPARRALADKLFRGNINERRNGLQIAIQGNFAEAASAIPTLLGVPELQLTAARAAGQFKAGSAVNLLIAMTSLKNELAQVAMVSLSQIGDEAAYPTAEALALSSNLLVRQAALQLMRQFPLRATDTGRRWLLQPEQRFIRIGVELLGLAATKEALAEVGSRLMDPSPMVRVEAILALRGQCPEEFRVTYLNLRNDPDPMVRAVAQRSDPGR